MSSRQLGWRKDSEEPSLPVNGSWGASPPWHRGWGAVGSEAGSLQGRGQRAGLSHRPDTSPLEEMQQTFKYFQTKQDTLKHPPAPAARI